MPIARLEDYKLFMTYGPKGGLIDVPSSSLTMLTQLSYGSAPADLDGYDDATANVDIGFSFNFDGISYTRMLINTNGVLIPTNLTPEQENGSGFSGFTPNILPAAFPKICPYWSDQRTAPFSASNGGLGGIFYGNAQYGLDRHKIFVVRFKNMRTSWTSPKSMITYEAVFHQRTNIIEFNYEGYEVIHDGGGVVDINGVPVISASGSNSDGNARLRHCLQNTNPLGGSSTIWTLTSFAAQYPGGMKGEEKLPKRFIFSPPKGESDVFSNDISFTGNISG